jgi:hypothetical protein
MSLQQFTDTTTFTGLQVGEYYGDRDDGER